MGLREDAKAKLAEYEALETERRSYIRRHEPVFSRLEQIEAGMAKVKDELSRLFYTKSGPPKEVPEGKKSFVWAKGAEHMLQVQYKKKADFYDPTKLPNDILTIPGVVMAVSTEMLDLLVAAKSSGVIGEKIAAARSKGAWMKPVVVLPRLAEENTEGDTEVEDA
jgi:hypothetical protein